MIEYRSFRNYDPPHLNRLWQQAGLGQGAARNLSLDLSFDMVNFSQRYFDPAGLLIATDNEVPIGFCHAGFGSDAEGRDLSFQIGIICAVIVHPQYRRQGIGRELVSRATQYLKSKGARRIQAGQSPGLDPFYFGMYGGAQPTGFLESDAAAAPFFQNLGFVPSSRYSMLTRSMFDKDPVSFRMTMVRRKWEIVLVDHPEPCSFWWMARFGRMDALACVLVPRGGGKPVAGCTVVGLDLYVPSWNEQAIGIAELWVDDMQRRKGLGQTILIDVIKRLRQENVQRVVACSQTSDEAAQAVFRSVGFSAIDFGVVYDAPAA